MNQPLLNSLSRVEKLASASRLARLSHNPFRYLYSTLAVKAAHRLFRHEQNTTASLFFGKKITITLPSSTDIYLTGGKTHPSEIRLARFMLHTLAPGDHFMDIGAHFGYFSLLAAEITGSSGRVFSYEPSGKTYRLLAGNTRQSPSIETFRLAVSGSKGEIGFYEFPSLYSEYNTSDISQFEQEKWFRSFKPEHHIVDADTLDNILLSRTDFRPALIKIDVEGAESEVIEGGQEYLDSHTPVIVMEYLSDARGNLSHVRAHGKLERMGYKAFAMDEKGRTQPCPDVQAHLAAQQLDSDNIVFIK